jgi:hypothetical protein
MKKILLPLFAMAFCVIAYAQQSVANKKAFSVGPELGIPNQSVFNIGYGASVKFEIPVVSPLSFSLTAGYNKFKYKSIRVGSSVTPEAASFIPLKAAAKYYLSQGFYAEGELGTVIETNYQENKLFAFSAGPGFIFPIKGGGIDLGFRYERWSNKLRQTGIRVAYRFDW